MQRKPGGRHLLPGVEVGAVAAGQGQCMKATTKRWPPGEQGRPGHLVHYTGGSAIKAL